MFMVWPGCLLPYVCWSLFWPTHFVVPSWKSTHHCSISQQVLGFVQNPKPVFQIPTVPPELFENRPSPRTWVFLAHILICTDSRTHIVPFRVIQHLLARHAQGTVGWAGILKEKVCGWLVAAQSLASCGRSWSCSARCCGTGEGTSTSSVAQAQVLCGKMRPILVLLIISFVACCSAGIYQQCSGGKSSSIRWWDQVLINNLLVGRLRNIFVGESGGDVTSCKWACGRSCKLTLFYFLCVCETLCWSFVLKRKRRIWNVF